MFRAYSHNYASTKVCDLSKELPDEPPEGTKEDVKSQVETAAAQKVD
jgi:hypothetical protein